MRVVQEQKTRISTLESIVKQLKNAIQDDKKYIADLNTKCQNLEAKLEQYQPATRGTLLQRTLT